MNRNLALAMVASLATGCVCSKCKPDTKIDFGDVFHVYGDLVVTGSSGPRPKLMAVAYATDPGCPVEWNLTDRMEGKPTYGIVIPAGNYDVLIFADLDHDGFFDRKELVGRASVPSVGLITLDDYWVEGPPIAVDLAKPPLDAGFAFHEPADGKGPLLPGLADPFFAPSWGPDGLWWPSRVLRHTQGEMLFGLKDMDEEVDPNKVQVIFVHGVKATPNNFAALSATLEYERYQRWYLFYPTGLGLDKMGANLALFVKMLASRADTVLVAHSMGGLVARSAIRHLEEEIPMQVPQRLKGYISLATPYGGFAWADPMVTLPTIRPSLQDVAPESWFLHTLYDMDMPSQLKFHLFWGDENGDGKGDGTVPRSSALYGPMVHQAIAVHPFLENHDGMLGGDGDAEATRLLQDFHATLESLTAP